MALLDRAVAEVEVSGWCIWLICLVKRCLSRVDNWVNNCVK